ncbi:armadillo repeat only 2 [Forsythia ovata]|uniref:Armadillo repeat only 2 n=1 Tax=Forsythia ovata TaxID=205694 RepID=A0ABD1UX77_9LAMI
MKVQVVMVWEVSELVAHYPKCQDLFVQHNIIHLLVGHLAFETMQEHSKYLVVNKTTSMHLAFVLASNNNANANANIGANKRNDLDEDRSQIQLPFGNKQLLNRMHNVVTNSMALKGQTNGLNQDNVAKSNGNNGVMLNSISNHQQSLSLSGANNKAREMEDPSTKTYMKAMVARALWHPPKGIHPFAKA